MNVFEYAMKMEMDGKSYYEDSAAKVTHPQFKRILLELAADEQKHYNIFRAMRDGLVAEYKESEQTHIFESVKNIFEELTASGRHFEFDDDAKKLWLYAQELEKQAEDFYRQRAEEIDNDNNRRILHRIADEEHKHWVTMENIIKFIDRPEHWLENAEWNQLEDY